MLAIEYVIKQIKFYLKTYLNGIISFKHGYYCPLMYFKQYFLKKSISA